MHQNFMGIFGKCHVDEVQQAWEMSGVPSVGERSTSSMLKHFAARSISVRQSASKRRAESLV